MIYNGSNRSIIIIILMGHGNIHKRRRGRRMVDDESHRFLPVVYGRTTTSSPTRIGEISNQYANQKVYYFSSINEIFDHHPHHPPHSYSYMEYKFDIPSEGAIAITYGQQPELAHTHPFCTWITSVYSLNLSLFLSPISGYDSCLVTWEFQC